MAQLSLYLDKQTMVRLEKAAKNEKLSLSKWVRSRIVGGLTEDWPADYFKLFGSVEDNSLVRPQQPSFDKDAKRVSF